MLPGPANSADPDAVVSDWQVVAAAVSRVQRHVDEALEQAGVPAAWFAVLHQLLDADDHRLPMSRLAREVSMTTGGFTKLADRMARDGLIDRRGSADDRRVVHASLSPDGLATARRAARVYRDALQASVLDSISREDLAGTARAMRDLTVPDGETPAEDPAGTFGEAPTGHRPAEQHRAEFVVGDDAAAHRRRREDRS